MPNGYPINWALPAGSKLTSHPLYIKYASSTFDSINANLVKADLGSVMARPENAEICAYLSWLYRTVTIVTAP
jgi:hypothetical protein